MSSKITRSSYAEMFGPTTGDKVRLADTDLFIEVENDLTVYGEEVKFGGGKVIRDGMGQSQVTRKDGAVDTVITNALIVDVNGIFKADIGIKDGIIQKIGKSGNPDTQPKIDIIIGPGTEIIAGEGKIITAGGFDSHIHYICPQQIDDALHSGLTTMLGGGTGPAHGTLATTCTPGSWHIGKMIQSADAFSMNLAFAGKGNSSKPEGLIEQVNAGACALKLHEDWGTTPGAIDNCLNVADKMDVQVMIHTDTLNESGFVENTIKAINNRTIHAFHTEGAGGGHARPAWRAALPPAARRSFINSSLSGAPRSPAITTKRVPLPSCVTSGNLAPSHDKWCINAWAKFCCPGAMLSDCSAASSSAHRLWKGAGSIFMSLRRSRRRRRRSPRNLERKMYNYSRNTTARREVNVKETTRHMAAECPCNHMAQECVLRAAFMRHGVAVESLTEIAGGWKSMRGACRIRRPSHNR